ncbi:MAG TPA: hypothetical protein DCM87_06305 [Planctomycetes bacterium]|nr:hypothetical protein [Planctomycetota bacterium]
MPSIVFERGSLRGKRFILPAGGIIRIGRDQTCQVQVRDTMVSRVHCILRGEKGVWSIEDAGSSNGTVVNGAAVRKSPLAPGDLVCIGDSAFSCLATHDDPWIGTTLGGYRLEARVGRGGMGTVYRAHQLSLEREVALKILATSLGTNPEFVARFMKEARAAARLNHPNVVQVHDAGCEGDTHFIAMEYLPGGALEDVMLRRGPIPFREAVPIACDALKALAFAQAHGIVHRDIKPGNLLFAGDGAVKVCDLGIALDLRQPDAGREGATAGSPAYMAPEQVRGEALDHRADLYALGATLYHAIAGVPPIEGATVKEIVNKKVSQEAPPLKDRVPGVPPRLSHVVARLLALNPADRLASAQEAEAALTAALRAPAPVLRESPVVHEASQKKPGPAARIAAMAAAAAALLVVVFLVVRYSGAPAHETAKGTPAPASASTLAANAALAPNPAPAPAAAAPEAAVAPEPAIAARETPRAEELERAAAEAEAARAAREQAARIEGLLAENDLARAAAAIEGLPASAELAPVRALFAETLRSKIEAELTACMSRVAALCDAHRFEDARADVEKLRARLPGAESARIEPLLQAVAKAYDARAAVVEGVRLVTRDVMARMGGLDFPAASRAIEDFLAERPAAADDLASLGAEAEGAAALWERLTGAFKDAAASGKETDLAFLPDPLGSPVEGRFRVMAIARDRLSLESAGAGKRREMRSVFEVTPDAILAILGDAQLRPPLGLLWLLRAGKEPAAALLLAPDLPAETRAENEMRAADHGAVWLTARYEALKAFREELAGAANAAPETRVFAVREAARLLCAWPNAHADIAGALRAWFVADRAGILASGPLESFFHAKSVKTPRAGSVHLTYDFASEAQIEDFTPVPRAALPGTAAPARGGRGTTGAEPERPARRWLADKKALELEGEVRFLHGDPFEETIIVTGRVAACFADAPNVNIAFFTSPEDRVTFTMREYDGSWRRRTGRSMRPEYLVLGMGYYVPLINVPAEEAEQPLIDPARGGGGVLRAALPEPGVRVPGPVYTREPCYVIMTGEHGWNLGRSLEQLLWAQGGSGKIAAPFVFQAGVGRGAIQWLVKGKAVSFPRAPEIARLGDTLSTQGSFSLFTAGSRVAYAGVEVQGKLRADWPAREAERRAREELARIAPRKEIAATPSGAGAVVPRPKAAETGVAAVPEEEPEKPTGVWAFFDRHKDKLFGCPAKFSGGRVLLDYSNGRDLERDAIVKKLGKSKLVFQRESASTWRQTSFDAGGDMSCFFIEPQFVRQVRVSMTVALEVVAAGDAYVVVHVMNDKSGNGYGCKFGAIAGHVTGVFGFRAGAPSTVAGAMTKPPKDWVVKTSSEWALDLAWPEGEDAGSLTAILSGRDVSRIERIKPASPGAFPAGRVGVSWNKCMFAARSLQIEGVLDQVWAVEKLQGLGVEIPEEILVGAGLKKRTAGTSAEPAPEAPRKPEEPQKPEEPAAPVPAEPSARGSPE